MKIYQAEKKDGIDLSLNGEGNSSIFLTSQAKIGDIQRYCENMSVADMLDADSAVQTVEELLGSDQPDLALVVAILVSTGWNLNDDIFTPEEVWAARSTPLHKPMNDNHQAEKILGHIVKARALDKNGDEIEGDTPPSEFDIEVAGVLYKAFEPLADRIEEILAKAKAGELFVSMEAWFPDFCYGLIDPSTGQTKLIERNEETAFLTKHLRIYGGEGQYQGYRIGRVLKNIVFGAQGFVETPANPESVIKVAANKMDVSDVFVTAELSELSEGGVEDVDAKELKELQAKLEEAQASLESKVGEIAELQKAAEEVKAKNYEGQIATLVEKVDELLASSQEASEKIEAVEAEKAELQKQLDEATQRAEKSDAELDEIRKTDMARDRLGKLSDVKEITDEEATLAELRDMTDETFELVLKYAGENSKGESVETEDVETEETKAEAALESVEEENDAEFTATEDVAKTETDQWVSTAHALLKRSEQKD